MYQEEFLRKITSTLDELKKIKEVDSLNDHDIHNQKKDIISSFLVENIKQNNYLWDIPTNESITSHRKKIGKIIVFFKKIIRKLLYWLVSKPLLQQKEFNGSITRSLNEVLNVLTNLQKKSNNIDELSTKLKQIEEILVQINKLSDKSSKIETSMNQIIKSQEKSNNLINELKNRDNFPVDYRKFEDNFRGNEEKIARQQFEIYYPYVTTKNSLLDLGCGRGELISQFSTLGFNVTGIDNNHELINYCLNQGLNVVEDDLIHYLNTTEHQFDVITCLHVIEHLYPNQIVDLVNKAYNSLNDDGLFILETPNPECIYNLAFGFSIDMTHKQPVHSYTLKFILEQIGFKEVQIKHLNPVDESVSLQLNHSNESINENFEKINRLLFGYQNYAIVGRK